MICPRTTATLRRTILAVAALLLAVGLGPRAQAAPLEIDPGPLFLQTVPTTFMDLDLSSLGVTSGPVFVDLEGNPGPGPIPVELVSLQLSGAGPVQLRPDNSSVGSAAHELVSATASGGPGSADTIIDILSPLTLPNPGDSGTVDIELVALSLRSVGPVELELSGSYTSFFDIFVEIDPLATQQIGFLNITRTTETAGFFDFLLPEDLIVTLVDTTGTIGPITQDIFLTLIGGGTFESPVEVPEPATLALLGAALAALGFARRRRRTL